VRLGLHQEMAYLPNHPSKLVFFCNVAPDSGGETLVGDMRRYTASIPTRLIDKIEAHGVHYLRNFRSIDAPHAADAPERIEFMHMAWQKAFDTTERAEVERACDDLGLGWSWEPDGSVTTSFTAPGIETHPQGGGPVSFNMLHSLHSFLSLLGAEWWPKCRARYLAGGPPPPYYVEFGNREQLDLADSKLLFELVDTFAVAPAWQAGDVLMVDNLLAAHGRNPFTGKRDVQVALLS
jgi:hypothetical protein